MANANEILGVMHAFYGAGGVIAPLIATSMITKANLQWYHFYYIMIAAALIELAATLSAFWKATGKVFVDSHPKTSDNAGNSSLKEALLKMPAARVTWLCALFLLCYVGVEVALGGWIVKFMLEVRDGEPFASGMTATGFWLGITVGRVVLGFITPMLGEKLAVMVSEHTHTHLTYLPHPPPSHCPVLYYILTLPTNADLPPRSNGPRTPLLARPPVLRLRSSSIPPGLLPRPPVSRSRRRRHKVPTKTPARQRSGLRCRLRRRGCGHPALRGRCHCPVQGRRRASAHHPGAAGSLVVAVGWVA